MRVQPARPDKTVAEIAAGQHGVVTYAQLIAAGLSQTTIRRRVTARRLFRVDRGVYAVGHEGLSERGTWKAATLACGEGAVLSHISAAALWGVIEPRGGRTHVTVPTEAGRAHPPAPDSWRLVATWRR